MKTYLRFFVSCWLIFVFFFQALPCGPSYISPIFDFKRAPEAPFENFAAGNLGIVKPSQRRVVLFAAYRYLSGGGFTPDEQKALIQVWEAEFNYEPLDDRDAINEAVRNWKKKRAEVFEDQEKRLPPIYVEREYGGYDFFPNCTKNAFETATETLSDRIGSHGAQNGAVRDWVTAQDAVFSNCSTGSQKPAPSNETQPEWLRKDRAYQIAAADFYSLNFAEAKRRFAEIAQDYDSPWQQTADYLVGRTLIRQASLTKSEEQAKMIYTEAGQHLEAVAARNAKYGRDAERLLGIVKYRLYPQERLTELAGKLSSQYGDEHFRQDLIDFNWLVDKFEKETLEAEEERKKESKEEAENANKRLERETPPKAPDDYERREKGEIITVSLFLTADSNANSGSYNYLTFNFKPDATDEEVFETFENRLGRKLTAEEAEKVNKSKAEAIEEYKRFISPNYKLSTQRRNEYQGGYYGSEKTSLALLPEFLRRQDLTEWLFTFQIESAEAYLHALAKYKETKTDLWLVAALAKAEKSSTDLNRLLEAAAKIGESSPAYPTVAYHRARILIETGKIAEARKVLDAVLDSAINLPISARNQLLAERVKIAETLDDFLRFAQRKPFAFDMDGQTGTIAEIIAEQKSWYDPQYDKRTREEYEKEVDANFADYQPWQERSMLDHDTVDVINQHFSTEMLLAAERSPALPDYLRGRMALAIWTRAVLLKDYANAARMAPHVVTQRPELEPLMNRFLNAQTPAAKQTAALYILLKNPMLTPYLEDGLPRSDNEFNNFDSNDWWCKPSDTEYDERLGDSVPRRIPRKPSFLTEAQSVAAQTERQRLTETGDAPKFLGEQVLAWAQRAPADKRLAESLFIVWEANGWTKYGCGGNIELRVQIGNALKKQFPYSEYAKKVFEEEKGEN